MPDLPKRAELELEKIRVHLPALPFPRHDLDFFEADGRILFPVEGTEYSMAYLMSGKYRYGMTIRGDETGQELRPLIRRAVNSLRNMIGALDA